MELAFDEPARFLIMAGKQFPVSMVNPQAGGPGVVDQDYVFPTDPLHDYIRDNITHIPRSAILAPGFRIEGLNQVGDLLDFPGSDAQSPGNAVDFPRSQIMQMFKNHLLRQRVGALGLAQLQQQAFRQVPRPDPGRIEILNYL